MAFYNFVLASLEKKIFVQLEHVPVFNALFGGFSGKNDLASTIPGIGVRLPEPFEFEPHYYWFLHYLRMFSSWDHPIYILRLQTQCSLLRDGPIFEELIGQLKNLIFLIKKIFRNNAGESIPLNWVENNFFEKSSISYIICLRITNP